MVCWTTERISLALVIVSNPSLQEPKPTQRGGSPRTGQRRPIQLEVVAGEIDKRLQRRRRLPVPHVSTSLVRTDADNPNNLRTLQVESQRRRPLQHTIEAQTTLVLSGSHRADPQPFDLSAFARDSFGKTRKSNRRAKGINPEPSPTTHARSDMAMVCGCMAHYHDLDP